MHRKKPGVLSIKATLQIKGRDKQIDVSMYCNKEAVATIPREQLEAKLTADLQSISLQKPFEIKTTHAFYSLADARDISRARQNAFANTILQAHLPYCLHLPSGQEMIVTYGSNKKAKITFEKIWTQNAIGSSEVDFFEKEHGLYLQKGVLTGPRNPINPQEGWEQKVTGTNVERTRDTNGIFRFSRIAIQFDTTVSDAQLDTPRDRQPPDDRTVVDSVVDEALAIVNTMLGVYRHVTKEDWVEPIGFLAVNDIYFVDLNRGVYLMSIGHGIGGAMINRPEKEINKIEDMLLSAESPPLYEILLMSAETALHKRSLTLAVVESFQALEIFITRYLFEAYLFAGLPEAQANKVLNVKWKIVDRLKEVLQDVRGVKLTSEPVLWRNWSRSYFDVRNPLIHSGRKPELTEAQSAIEANSAVITWVKSLQVKAKSVPLAEEILNGKKRPFLRKLINLFH
ncbi:hypothetical protein HY969_04265 [Candidatus Kaiserbacteria bacterium]|nr:hypothetical protein [Candidatus Kaiserbacteria bacterium]